MEHFTNEFCEIELHDKYSILTINENIDFTLNKASIIREKLRSYYKSKDFIMISYRKHQHKVSAEVYKKGQLENMKGLAIVSNNNKEREKAIIEQPLYDKSFTFFSTIEEAKSWAKSFF
ncbi:hypothetical protein [Aquimarina muelleri]|uniref:STAS/SEC14 domain-containing protein n=1 Tax=Aquimarina muelleri TaxID=279356 RepID=A0A918JUB2_9FLAO|nr:hypothetical protein [Aquimarina muelleri]MCX2761756.1 hypothetical protein [Aquimarina muelleri]GGX15949.1 hypothetical protein GCM10007384_16870 [Aquimarina muelleri]